MADPTEEEELVEPSLAPNDSTNDSAVDLTRVSRYYEDTVRASVNAQPSPKLKSAAGLPVLPEVTVTGYRGGEPFQLLCCRIGSFLLEKCTAYDFLLMRQAAREDGIRLDIVTAFRDMAYQTRLYEERKDPRVRARKGPAARPGHSNHQSGIAIDILVHMTVSDKKIGKYSREYRWLKAHASLFGFDNNEVEREPWHWRHLLQKVVGLGANSPDDYLAQVTNTDAAASSAVDIGQLHAKLLLSKNVYDKVTAFNRSTQMTLTTRDTLFACRAAHGVRLSAATANLAAQYDKAVAQAGASRPAFSPNETLPLYDFTTGRWDDETS